MVDPSARFEPIKIPLHDPVHGLDATRFARHADGRVEQAVLA